VELVARVGKWNGSQTLAPKPSSLSELAFRPLISLGFSILWKNPITYDINALRQQKSGSDRLLVGDVALDDDEVVGQRSRRSMHSLKSALRCLGWVKSKRQGEPLTSWKPLFPVSEGCQGRALRVASGELRPLTALRNRKFCYHEIDGAVYSARRVGNLPSPLLAENRSPTAGGVTHPKQRGALRLLGS
jgi:hypothetical protein